MRAHQAYRAMLGARNDLSAAEETRLDAHLEECASCRRIAAEYTRQDAFLQGLRLPNPPAELRHGVFQRVAAEPPLARPSLLRRFALYAPVPLVVFLAVAVILQSHGSRRTASNVNQGLQYSPLHSPVNGAAKQLPSHAAASSPQVDSAAKRAAASLSVLQASPAIPPLARISSSMVSGGIALSLTLDRSSYPRNALVRATIHLRNASSRPIWIQGFNQACGFLSPWLRVTDDRGRQLVPLPTSSAGVLAGCSFAFRPTTVQRSLLPGRSVTAHAYTVLRARHVQALARITVYTRCSSHRKGCTGQAVTLAGTPLTVSLTPSHSPRVMLHGSPPTGLDLPGSQGPVTYSGWYTCQGVGTVYPSGKPVELQTAFGWQQSAGPHVTLPTDGCTSHINLHLVAGQLNQPAATINYQGH